jgi:hypothetical protein
MPKTLSRTEPPNFPTMRAWMTRTGTTQGHLASLLGLSEAAMSRRMDGSKAFEVLEAMRLAQITGAPVSELLPPEQAKDFLKLVSIETAAKSENRPDNDDVA